MYIIVNEGTCPTHFVVMFKNRFFKIDAYHRDNTLLNISELYSQLRSIKNEYKTKSSGIGIGSLTADNRDTWAEVYNN